MRVFGAFLVVACAGAVLAGCGDDLAGEGGRCASALDCRTGLICREEICQSRDRDAGRPADLDAQPVEDAAMPDGAAPPMDGAVALDGAADVDAAPDVDGAPPPADVVVPPVDAPPAGDAGPSTTCGDRMIVLPEECDDGNTTPGDGCSATCQRETSATCGDGTVDYAAGEECDDRNTTAGDGCDDACRVEVGASCGDGRLDIASGEQCDDSGNAPGDGCSPTCQLEPVGAFCGDGMIDSAAGEICDDTNTFNGDGCNPTCNFTNATSAALGMLAMPGSTDGIGAAARVGGAGVLTADASFVWYADGAARRLRRIDPTTLEIVTVAGDGMNRHLDGDGTAASFTGLESITTDGTTIWIGGSGYLRAVDAAPPYTVRTVAGNGSSAHVDGMGSAARFRDLRGVTYYRGLVYLLDASVERMTMPYRGGTLRVFDPATNVVRTLAGDPTPPTPPVPVDGAGWTVPGDPTMGLGAARFVSPRYMTSDNSGNLFIADTNGNTLRVYNTVTHVLSTFGGMFGMAAVVDGPLGTSRINRPRGITSDGTSIYFVEADQHVIRQGVIATTEITTMIGVAGMAGYVEGTGSAARLSGPFSITFHYPSRSLFVLDGANALIRRIR